MGLKCVICAKILTVFKQVSLTLSKFSIGQHTKLIPLVETNFNQISTWMDYFSLHINGTRDGHWNMRKHYNIEEVKAHSHHRQL